MGEKSWKPRFSVEAKKWHAWVMRFMNSKMRCIARIVRILGNYSLERIFVSKATLYIMHPLRYHRLCLARLKKPNGKYRQRPNNSNTKYGIRIPRNTKEDYQFNKENGNDLWANDILK